jgi:hypothetical protein
MGIHKHLKNNCDAETLYDVARYSCRGGTSLLDTAWDWAVLEVQKRTHDAEGIVESCCSFTVRPSFVVPQSAMLYQLNARHRGPCPRLGNRLKDYCNGVRTFEILIDKFL